MKLLSFHSRENHELTQIICSNSRCKNTLILILVLQIHLKFGLNLRQVLMETRFKDFSRPADTRPVTFSNPDPDDVRLLAFFFFFFNFRNAKIHLLFIAQSDTQQKRDLKLLDPSHAVWHKNLS